MRWIPLMALTVLVSGATAFAETDPSQPVAPKKNPKTPTSLPPSTAEPENGQYAAPVPREQAGPSQADVGPVLAHFARASTTDDLEETQNADNASLAIHEKVALDKHISVPKIHDVQNDGPGGTGSENHALAYEVDYLNWGAVTHEQMLARRGHYFTITWKNSGPKADFTAVFEYREVKSKEIVRTLVQPAHAISGATRSYFAVVDKAYQAYGPVVSWRFTVRKGDTVVAEAKSYIW